MQRLDRTTKDINTIMEALKGEYGTITLTNGIRVRYQGGIVHFQGLFDGTQEVIGIPRIPVRTPVTFTGDDFSCGTIAEPNSGFVNVPQKAKGGKFIVSGYSIIDV